VPAVMLVLLVLAGDYFLSCFVKWEISIQCSRYLFLMAEVMPYFFKDLEGYTGSIITKNAAKIVMLTGVCTQEMRFATWEEIDFERTIWEITH